MSVALQESSFQRRTVGAPLRSNNEDLTLISGILECPNIYIDPSRWLSLFVATGVGYACAYGRYGPVTRAAPQWTIPEPPSSQSLLIHKLRLLSGLTWEELAIALGVARRTAHNWANGEAIKTEHADHLREVVKIVEDIARSTSVETRASLIFRSPINLRAIDLLGEKRYSAAADMAQTAEIERVFVESGSTLAHPTAYLGALNEPIAPTSGAAVKGRKKRGPHRTR